MTETEHFDILDIVNTFKSIPEKNVCECVTFFEKIKKKLNLLKKKLFFFLKNPKLEI